MIEMVQYASSPRIRQLEEYMTDYFNNSINVEQFYNIIFNIDTAAGNGLDILGRRVGLTNGRYVSVPGDSVYFGFKQALPGITTFGFGGFYNGTQVTSNVYRLEDDPFRFMILAKSLTNFSRASIPAINTILRTLFPITRGRAFVIDAGNMSMLYSFNFQLTNWEIGIITTPGILPRPTGVLSNIMILPGVYFGFKQALPGVTTFGFGSFRPIGAIS